MSIYDSLNEMQKKAVFQTEGPVLILAGAGSGKTRVLTHRIAYLIEEKGVNPWNILAITFTNKAAGEMRERVDHLVGFGSESIWVSTFHSACVRILRRFIDRLGYDTNFTIYDTDDQKSLMKEVCKYLQIDTKTYRERALLNAISSAKNEMISPQEFLLQAEGDFSKQKIAEVYLEYEKQLRANNALDFDDLLVRAVQLFETQPDVLDYYQERFRYIMVDEYQDTNTVQFHLIRILSSKYRNLCVVGDDDQSIYKFRGANINNIGRKDKTLWTENPEGEKIACKQFDNAYDEADYIAAAIQKKVKEERASYKDCAVLYRTNAQSRIFEERFVSTNIPYKVIGGVNFYARREIKDLLAYLRTIENGRDDLAVRRIINVPKRGIGLTSINRVQEYALQKETGFYEALLAADLIPGIGRALSKLESFVALIEHFKEEAGRLTPLALLTDIIETLDYENYLEEIDMEDAESRIENIEELKSKLASYEESCEEAGEQPTLSGFLEEVALVADIDNLDEESDYVVLMTLHSAKGLEFSYVFLAGMEDGLFPSYMTITADDPMELEEERRLCYVGITRAMKELTLTCAKRRMVRGETQYNIASRFLKEIPESLIGTASGTLRERPQMEIARNQTYAKAKAAFHSQAFGIKRPVQQFKVASGEGPGYDVGDRVRHMKFGEGLVTAITEGGRDYEVTVEFDRFGVKKMFAAFAKLQKIDESGF